MGDPAVLTSWQAVLSGVGYPLLGPDHFLFLLGIALGGTQETKQWGCPLLAVGLVGSALVQLQPLPDVLAFWAEVHVSLSLAIEGLIVLKLLRLKWLFSMFSLYGY